MLDFVKMITSTSSAMSTLILVIVGIILHRQINGNPTTLVYPGTREHKVHNIMLYPEKHSWCKSTPIKQIVTHSGCMSSELENNVCVGACFSFSVPRTIPETPGDDQLHYCDSCQPSTVAWTTVSLECPDNPAQPTMTKMVELIENCSCLTYVDQSRSREPIPDQYLEDINEAGSELDQALSSGEPDEDVNSSSQKGENVDDNDDLPVEISGTDNNIPKFPELKKQAILRLKAALKENHLNDTSVIDERIFMRPINMTMRDSILKSPGHQELLRQLQEGSTYTDDD